ncbi:MAG: hypothetical protein ACOYMA_14245 [Bacteroidia bacterium]
MTTKNIYRLLLLVLLLGTKALLVAQCNYEKSNNTVNVWDWRQEFYTDQMYIMIANNPSNFRVLSTVRSPFWPPTGGSSNSNLSRFYTTFSYSNSLNTVDCQPADGWELLAKEFGTPTDPQNCPFFCLYNRYTGVIRAFFLMGQVPTSPQNGAKIQMQHFTDVTHRESAIFSHLYPITKTVEQFIKGTIATNPNSYVNQQDFWQYADFPMAYDPCVCSYPSKIKFIYETMTTSFVELTASITGYNKQIIGGSSNNVSENQNAFDVAFGSAKSGVNGFNTWNEALTKIKEQADKQEAGTKSFIKKGLEKFGTKAQYIPYVGAAMGVIDAMKLQLDNK